MPHDIDLIQILIFQFLILSAIGFVGGFLSGIIGIGGGIITLSATYFIVPYTSIGPLSLATCTGLAAVQCVASCTSSSWTHFQQKRLHPPTTLIIGGIAMLGSAAGGLLTGVITDTALKWMYCITILLLMTLYLRKKEKPSTRSKTPTLPTTGFGLLNNPNQSNVLKIMTVLGTFFSGAVAGLMGIGGSVFLIPIMAVFLGIPTIIAIGCGAGTALMVSIASMVSKAAGGHIIWNTAAIIAISAFMGGRFGALCTRHVPSHLLQKLLLTVMGVGLIRMAIELLS